jgi:hypothetical protein
MAIVIDRNMILICCKMIKSQMNSHMKIVENRLQQMRLSKSPDLFRLPGEKW